MARNLIWEMAGNASVGGGNRMQQTSLLKIIRHDWQLDAIVDDRTLRQWEASSGLTLPEDYGTFLLKYNGGVICPWMFHHHHPLVEERNRIMMLDYLYDWSRVLHYSQLDISPAKRTLPPQHILIGQDPGGGGILLSLAQENHGGVSYWLRLPLVWGEGLNNVVGTIARSFTDFVQQLHEDNETEHEDWDVLAAERPPEPFIL